jgi:hypothetical protein
LIAAGPANRNTGWFRSVSLAGDKLADISNKLPRAFLRKLCSLPMQFRIKVCHWHFIRRHLGRGLFKGFSVSMIGAGLKISI